MSTIILSIVLVASLIGMVAVALGMGVVAWRRRQERALMLRRIERLRAK